MSRKEQPPEPPDTNEPGEQPKGPFMCPKCHRPVDPYDPNSQRNASTRKWEHKDCRTKPRRTPI